MNDVKKSITGKDYLLLLVIFILMSTVFYAGHYLAIATPIKIIIWIVGLVLSCLLAFFTTKGQQIYLFFNEAKVELQKVVWPNRQETVQTTTIVMIMVSVTGFILWAIDSCMMLIIAKITHLG